MKIHIPIDSKQTRGGMWSWMENLRLGLKATQSILTNEISEADIILIGGASTLTQASLKALRAYDVPVVLRLDGIPEDWRNSGKGWARLKTAYEVCDFVICQSHFVANTTYVYLAHKTGEWKWYGYAIHNGVDTETFKPDGERYYTDEERQNQNIGPRYLFVQSRKDPNKRFEEAMHAMRQIHVEQPDAFFILAGEFEKHHIEHNFGLYDMERGKDWIYVGKPGKQDMAALYREADILLWPSFADPCPNTLIEALMCGMTVDYNDVEHMGGGSLEILEASKRKDFKDEYSASSMAERYCVHMREFIGIYKKDPWTKIT